jgi:hypothetical protein
MMKKLLFCLMFFAFATYAGAQTVIYEDDFESYTVGGYLAEQSDWWDTWSNAPGTTEDAFIVNEQANSPTKSVKVDGVSDLLLPMGNKVSGEYQVDFSYYVPSGFAAYFNFQRYESPGVEWVLEVYFEDDGSGVVHAGGENAATFTYTLNQWVPIQTIINLDTDWAELRINNVLIHEWQWSLTTAGVPSIVQLGGMNIFAGAQTGQTPQFYFDDFAFIELAAGNVPEVAVTPEEFIITAPAGMSVSDMLNVENVGTATLIYDVEVNYVIANTKNQPVEEYTEDFTYNYKNAILDLITDPVSKPGGEPASYPENVYLNYDGPNFTGVGLTDPSIFEVAARFPNELTLPHAGMELTTVDVFLNHTENCSFRLKIYGEGTDYEPGVVYVDQAFTAAFPDWHSITLNTPVTITGEDLWIGYRVVQNEGGIFPVGADEGPANPNGHFIKPGVGWTISTLDYNWNIRGILTGDGITQWLSVAPEVGTLEPEDDEDHTVTFDATDLALGEYEAVLKVKSNDIGNPKVIVPVTMNAVAGIEDPTIVVNPTSMEETLAPDATSTQDLTITNIGQEDLTFNIEIAYPVKQGQKQEFNFRDLGFIYGNTANEETDASAELRVVEGNRDMWDQQFVYDVQTSSALPSHAGSETDGNYFYTAIWNSASINKFDLDGTFIETFTIPGVTGLRDLAFDGEYFYGSNATGGTGIWEMDFVNKTLVSTIPYTGAVRAIAYDENADGFWVNNWSTALTLVSRTGTVLEVGAITPSCYGMAYDELSPGGPFMWLFTGTTTGGGCQIEQMDMTSSTLTGVSHSVSGDLGDAHIAGGLWMHPDIVAGTVTLGGCAQGEPNKVFGYELLAMAPPPDGWLSADPITGTVTSGNNLIIEIAYDATGLDFGEYDAAIVITSNDPANPTVEVPVTLVVSDMADPVIVVDPMELTQAIAPDQIETQEMTVGNEGSGTLSYEIDIEYMEGVGPEAVIIDEGFEGATFPPAGWAKFNVGGGTGWQILGAGVTPVPGWEGGTADPAPDGGTQMAFCTWETGGTSSNDQWVVTPQITVTGDTYLSFWMRYWPEDYDDNVEIKLSTTVQNSASAFTIMVDEFNFTTGSSMEWEYYEYNLAEFVDQGEQVYIAFREVVADNFNDGAAIFLDNVMVEQSLSWLSVDPDEGDVDPMEEDVITVTFNSTGLDIGIYNAELHIFSNDPENDVVNVPVTLDVITGVNELGEPNAVMVYPNPASDFVRVQSNHNIREIKLYNSTGQLVVNKSIDEQSFNINTSDMATGIYLLQIETEAGISSRKVMIR